eukprot:m.142034 g.142034  ORF g.142034 m.142034 type:complete len:195 (-) comp13195_c0_seq50:4143-4727(-)
MKIFPTTHLMVRGRNRLFHHPLLWSHKRSDGILSSYCDASFAADVTTRRSRSGYVLFRSGGPVSWSSKNQHTVATASADAEYMAQAMAAQEVMFLRQFEEELFGATLQQPTILYSDNQPAIRVTTRSATRMRHILIKYHYIRDCVDNGRIELKYLPTNDMVADLLTKILPKPQTTKFCTMLYSASQHPLTRQHS